MNICVDMRNLFVCFKSCSISESGTNEDIFRVDLLSGKR